MSLKLGASGVGYDGRLKHPSTSSRHRDFRTKHPQISHAGSGSFDKRSFVVNQSIRSTVVMPQQGYRDSFPPFHRSCSARAVSGQKLWLCSGRVAGLAIWTETESDIRRCISQVHSPLLIPEERTLIRRTLPFPIKQGQPNKANGLNVVNGGISYWFCPRTYSTIFVSSQQMHDCVNIISSDSKSPAPPSQRQKIRS